MALWVGFGKQFQNFLSSLLETEGVSGWARLRAEGFGVGVMSDFLV